METRHSPGKVFLYRSLGKIHRAFQLGLHLIFRLANYGKKEEIPSIKNVLLVTPASSLAAKIRKKKLKSADLVLIYISRIKEVNPCINAVVADRFSEALNEAIQIDKFIESGQKTEEQMERETPFLGVPFTSKEIITVAGLPVCAGLVSRKDVKGERDSKAVQLVRESGGIPLAVTNIPELAMWTESNNTVYGRTLNPYDSSRCSGGSSGGEGSIIAAAGSVIGLGNDVAGSIRIPSSFNGIFGHKPTPGIVSNEGTYCTINQELECYLSVGPMCRYATDLLPMMKVLASKNSERLCFDIPVDLSTLKVFYLEDAGDYGLFTRVHPDIKSAMAKALRHFENAYRIKPQKSEIKVMKNAADMCFGTVFEKGGFQLSKGLTEGKREISLVKEFCLWFIGQSNHTLNILLQIIFEKVWPSVNPYKEISALNAVSDVLRSFQAELGENGVFFYPTWPEPAPFHNQPLFKPFDFAYTCLFNILGLPVTHCPLGLSREGLPIGIQVVSNVNNDRLCMAVAVELEKVFGGWISPCPVLE